MAYEFKKLSDVAAVETPADTANILIEEDGVIKKVAKGKVGGVKVASTAEVGQAIVVKAIDENGNPTEWKCADLATQPDMVITVNELIDHRKKPSLNDVSTTSGSFEVLHDIILAGRVPNVVVRFCKNSNHIDEYYQVEATELKASVYWYGSGAIIKTVVNDYNNRLICYEFTYSEGELIATRMRYHEGTEVS